MPGLDSGALKARVYAGADGSADQDYFQGHRWRVFVQTEDGSARIGLTGDWRKRMLRQYNCTELLKFDSGASRVCIKNYPN